MKWFDTRKSVRVRPRFLNELPPENYAPFGTQLAGISLPSANLAAFDLEVTESSTSHLACGEAGDHTFRVGDDSPRTLSFPS